MAIISDRAYPFFKGGGEKRYWSIALGLVRHGYDVHFYTAQWPGMQSEMTIDGIRLHSVHRVSSFYVDGKKSIRESLLYALKLFPRLMRDELDVVDCEQMPLFPIFVVKLVCLLKGKPLHVTWYEPWDRYWFRYLGASGLLGFLVERMAVRLADRVISISHHTTDGLTRRLRVDAGKIHTIPHGIDLAGIDAVPPAVTCFDVIYVGRLLTHKNVDMLIGAIGRLREEKVSVRCAIVGDGPERARLQALADARGLRDNVAFMGALATDAEVYALMKASGVLVLPSEREGFGIVVVEAMACGIPVVTVDHADNAARHLIEHDKNGHICAANERALAASIGAFLGGGLRERMAPHCLRAARRWDAVAVIDSLLLAYSP